MLYKDLDLPFQKIPPNFKPAISLEPSISSSFHHINKEFVVYPHPVIEKMTVYSLEDHPSVVCIVRDQCFPSRFDKGSDVYNKKAQESVDRIVGFSLQPYTPEEQEQLKALGPVSFGTDIKKKVFPFDPIEREVLYFSEASSKLWTVNLTYMADFFIHHKAQKELNFEMFHKYVHDYGALLNTHIFFANRFEFHRGQPLSKDDLPKKAMGSLDEIRKYARIV